MNLKMEHVHKFYHRKTQEYYAAKQLENEVGFAKRSAQVYSQPLRAWTREDFIPQGERYKWIEDHFSQVNLFSK
jgi:hypothetical protein